MINLDNMKKKLNKDEISLIFSFFLLTTYLTALGRRHLTRESKSVHDDIWLYCTCWIVTGVVELWPQVQHQNCHSLFYVLVSFEKELFLRKNCINKTNDITQFFTTKIKWRKYRVFQK